MTVRAACSQPTRKEQSLFCLPPAETLTNCLRRWILIFRSPQGTGIGVEAVGPMPMPRPRAREMVVSTPRTTDIDFALSTYTSLLGSKPTSAKRAPYTSESMVGWVALLRSVVYPSHRWVGLRARQGYGKIDVNRKTKSLNTLHVDSRTSPETAGHTTSPTRQKKSNSYFIMSPREGRQTRNRSDETLSWSRDKNFKLDTKHAMVLPLTIRCRGAAPSLPRTPQGA